MRHERGALLCTRPLYELRYCQVCGRRASVELLFPGSLGWWTVCEPDGVTVWTRAILRMLFLVEHGA